MVCAARSSYAQLPLAATAAAKLAAAQNPKRRRRRRNRYSKRNEGLFVDHEYVDHAHDTPTAEQLVELSLPIPSGRGGSHAPPFPMKLHEALALMEKDGHGDKIHWQPHGRCFVIAKPTEFIQVCSKYFPSISKITSFQRQLNLYGFKRITQGMDKGCYYHDKFLRGERYLFLAHQMERVKVKGTGVKARANPDQEPHFWAMEPVGLPPNAATDGSATSEDGTAPSNPSSSKTLEGVLHGKGSSVDIKMVTGKNNKTLSLMNHTDEVVDDDPSSKESASTTNPKSDPTSTATLVLDSVALVNQEYREEEDGGSHDPNPSAAATTVSYNSSSDSSYVSMTHTYDNQTRSNAQDTLSSTMEEDTTIVANQTKASEDRLPEEESLVLAKLPVGFATPTIQGASQHVDGKPTVSDWGASFYSIEPRRMLQDQQRVVSDSAASKQQHVNGSQQDFPHTSTVSREGESTVPHEEVEDSVFKMMQNDPFLADAMAMDFGRFHEDEDDTEQRGHHAVKELNVSAASDVTSGVSAAQSPHEESQQAISHHSSSEDIQAEPLYTFLENHPFMGDAMEADFGLCHSADWGSYQSQSSSHHASKAVSSTTGTNALSNHDASHDVVVGSQQVSATVSQPAPYWNDPFLSIGIG